MQRAAAWEPYKRSLQKSPSSSRLQISAAPTFPIRGRRATAYGADVTALGSLTCRRPSSHESFKRTRTCSRMISAMAQATAWYRSLRHTCRQREGRRAEEARRLVRWFGRVRSRLDRGARIQTTSRAALRLLLLVLIPPRKDRQSLRLPWRRLISLERGDGRCRRRYRATRRCTRP